MTISFITRLFQFLIPRVRTKRFEILLPLDYDDGSDIEAEKLEQTRKELRDRFGAITQNTVIVIGTWTWKYFGTRYDKLVRIRVDTNDPTALDAFKQYKQAWKNRFRKTDIWITARSRLPFQREHFI